MFIYLSFFLSINWNHITFCLFPRSNFYASWQAVEYELLSAHATELQEKKVGDGKTPPQQVGII